MNKKGYVYVMTNWNNRAIYIGVTSNLRKRVYQHKKHLFPGFTDQYNCTKLVYFEEYNDIDSAIRREKQLKNWHRQWKKDLISNFNKEWKDFSEDF